MARGPEVTNAGDEAPDGEEAEDHVLGPLEFDRDDLVYYASCSCGQRFGPLAAVPTLQAAFEHHRAARQPYAGTSDPPSP